MEKTALVTVFFGGMHELRRRATLRALQSWDEQEYKPDEAVFLELVCPGELPCFSEKDMPEWLRYLRLYGEDRNKGIFQKEAMWNLSVKYLNADKLMFIDSDTIAIDNPRHFKLLYNASSPGKCIHVAEKILVEAPDGSVKTRWSEFSPRKDRETAFPGLGFVLNRNDLLDIDGFNPYSVTSCGDDVFLYEVVRKVRSRFWKSTRFLYGVARKNLMQLEPMCIENTTTMHMNHNRPDEVRVDRHVINAVVELCGLPQSYVHLDPSGLVAWNDPQGLPRHIICGVGGCKSRDEVKARISGIVSGRLDELQQSWGQGHESERPFNTVL